MVPGRVFSDSSLKNGMVETVQGSKLQIKSSHGKPYVNNAKLLTTDIDTKNGVIHVIDTVLMPSKESMAQGRIR